jgi:hypothetical protein
VLKFPIIYPGLRLDYKVATHPLKEYLPRRDCGADICHDQRQ